MFNVIEGATAVTKCKGIYRQGKVYVRDERIYLQWSNGFITVSKASGRWTTSLPDVILDEINLPFDVKYTDTGFMVTKEYKETKRQTVEEVNAIIASSITKGKIK